MAEATNITFTPQSAGTGYREAVVTAVASATETITLTSHEYACDTIKSAVAHVAATGVPITYAFSGNVLTRTTSGSDVADVIRILY